MPAKKRPVSKAAPTPTKVKRTGKTGAGGGAGIAKAGLEQMPQRTNPGASTMTGRQQTQETKPEPLLDIGTDDHKDHAPVSKKPLKTTPHWRSGK